MAGNKYCNNKVLSRRDARKKMALGRKLCTFVPTVRFSRLAEILQSLRSCWCSLVKLFVDTIFSYISITRIFVSFLKIRFRFSTTIKSCSCLIFSTLRKSSKFLWGDMNLSIYLGSWIFLFFSLLHVLQSQRVKLKAFTHIFCISQV